MTVHLGPCREGVELWCKCCDARSPITVGRACFEDVSILVDLVREMSCSWVRYVGCRIVRFLFVGRWVFPPVIFVTGAAGSRDSTGVGGSKTQGPSCRRNRSIEVNTSAAVFTVEVSPSDLPIQPMTSVTELPAAHKSPSVTAPSRFAKR